MYHETQSYKRNTMSRENEIHYEIKNKFGFTTECLNEAEIDEKLLKMLADNCSDGIGGENYFYLPTPIRIGSIGNYTAYCVAFHKSSEGGICLSVVYDAHAGYFGKFAYVTDTNIRNNDYETRELGEDNKFSEPFKMNLSMYNNYKARIYTQARTPMVQDEARAYTKLRIKVGNIRYQCEKENRTYTLEEAQFIYLEEHLHAKYNCNDFQVDAKKKWREFKDMTPKQYISWKASQKKMNDEAMSILDEILAEQKDKK